MVLATQIIWSVGLERDLANLVGWKLGKSYSVVNYFFLNRRQPSSEDLYKIAEILNVSIKDLLIEIKRDNEIS
jgi:transcriptional regulator with XRE-family HTH domain